MRLMIFLQGTAITHASPIGTTREEMVRQSLRRDPPVLDYINYVPAGRANEKLQRWEQQGAEISYLSSHENANDIELDKVVLSRYGFPEREIYFRKQGENYKEIVERVSPEIYIEDDCESIGGAKEMTSTHFSPEAKKRIITIVVKEFQGIDNLPDSLDQLKIF